MNWRKSPGPGRGAIDSYDHGAGTGANVFESEKGKWTLFSIDRDINLQCIIHGASTCILVTIIIEFRHFSSKEENIV